MITVFLLGFRMELKTSNMSEEPEQDSAQYHTASLVFYSFVVVIGVVVNLTALWVFALTTKKRNSINVYMINVAVVDLTYILLLPFRMVYHYNLGYWPFGELFCKASAALTVFYPCTALWLLALISADRYMAIVQPRHSKELRNIPKTALACAGVWLMTLCSTVPLLYSADDPDRASNHTTCRMLQDVLQGRRDGGVSLARLVFFFLVPVALMLGCYVVIVHNLVHGRTSKLKPKVKQKSIRIIITLIAQVLVCFVPFHIHLVLRVVGVADAGGGGGAERPYATWAVFTTFLMSLSTVLDVVLYYIVSKQFQDRVISVILYRNYLRSVRRKSRRAGSGRSVSNFTSAMI